MISSNRLMRASNGFLFTGFCFGVAGGRFSACGAFAAFGTTSRFSSQSR